MVSVAPVRHLAPSQSVIEDRDECDFYWGKLLSYWKLPKHLRHFPGAHPKSLERADLQRVQSDDFLVALKTDGVRHIMMMTLKPNTMEPITVLFDRTRKMYEVIVWANEEYFQNGTLMDGELVWHDNSLVYIVFDVMLSKGVSCTHMAYRDRLQVLHNTIMVTRETNQDELEKRIAEEDKLIACDNTYNLQILPKRCVAKENLQTLWDDRTDLAHANDGLVFTLNTGKVCIGTSDTILKWKPDHSIDVQLRRTGAELCVFANNNSSDELVDISRTFSGYTIVLHANRLIEVIEPQLPCIVECVVRITEDTLHLTPERQRSDKTAPNSLHTIEATIRNTIEAISSDELVAAFTRS